MTLRYGDPVVVNDGNGFGVVLVVLGDLSIVLFQNGRLLRFPTVVLERSRDLLAQWEVRP